jgi:hypothetical protein
MEVTGHKTRSVFEGSDRVTPVTRTADSMTDTADPIPFFGGVMEPAAFIMNRRMLVGV